MKVHLLCCLAALSAALAGEVREAVMEAPPPASGEIRATAGEEVADAVRVALADGRAHRTE